MLVRTCSRLPSDRGCKPNPPIGKDESAFGVSRGLRNLDASYLDPPLASKMNQQPDLYFPAYAMSTANRSPRSSRPGYNTTTGHPGLNRLDQRQMDPAGQAPTALFATDDRFGSYDSNAFRHNRMQPSPGFAGDNFIGNAQAWAYNSGASTVTGAMGEGRLRSGARRAIPQVRFPHLAPDCPFGPADEPLC